MVFLQASLMLRRRGGCGSVTPKLSGLSRISRVRRSPVNLLATLLRKWLTALLQASLKDYFEKNYKQGRLFDHEEYRHDPKDWCWVHTALDVKVPWENDGTCMYTFCVAFIRTPAELRNCRSFSQVWQDALDLTQASDASDVQCLFHYTNEFGFKNITDLRKTAVELFAMPSAFMNLM